jgi:uncharacterized protein (TIGR02246 family)
MRIRNLSVLAVVAALTLLLGCEKDHRETAVDADDRAIRTVIDEMTNAYVARDWDAFTSFFTDDGIWMPPGFAPLSGKDAWWSFVRPWWDSSRVIDIGVTIEDLNVIGDWAIERHTEFQVTSSGDNSEPVSFYFKGVWIFRRQQDGSWKIAQYIWNMNTPPA